MTVSISTAQPDALCGGIVCCPAVAPAKLPWFRLVVGIFVTAQTMVLGMTLNLTVPEDRATLLMLQGGMLAATLVVMALLGLPLAIEAWRQMRAGRVAMEWLFLAGIFSTLAISCWSMARGVGPIYFEVVNILLVIYSVGHGVMAHSRTRAIAATQTLLQQVAEARLANGTRVPATSIRIGDRVMVTPGELIPVDGVVVTGQSLVRTTAFSGEWQSCVKRAGDAVLAGTGCEDGTLLIEATADGLDRRIDRLAALIASACRSTSSMQQQADRYVRVLVPVVALVSVGTAMYWGQRADWSTGIFNALAVVLVACPCAAGLATPLAVWTAIGRLADKGLLLKSAVALERLASVQGVIFDKTGTLADERLILKDLQTAPDPMQRSRTLSIIAQVERHSEHPVARALRELPAPGDDVAMEVIAIRILPAIGIEAEVQLAGRPAVVRIARREIPSDLTPGELTIDATLDGVWIATAVFSEHLRDSASAAVEQLKDMGLSVQIMTGDSSEAARRAAAIAPVVAGMTPEQKHAAAGEVQDHVLFIGDGVNDAAAMAASRCSIAMATGAAVTLEAADGTLHNGDLSLIPQAIDLARRTVNTIRSNFAWAMVYNMIGMPLAAMGWLHPVVASILMSASSAIVAWRSFNLVKSAAPLAEHSVPRPCTFGPPFSAPAAHQPTSFKVPPSNSPLPPVAATGTLPFSVYAMAHLIGLVGQGLILIALAQLTGPAGAVCILAFVLLAWGGIRFSNRLPAWADMTLAMFSIGGLGMNLGWWIDLHFDPAVRNGMVAACCMMSKTAQSAGMEANSHWMYWLMLLAGVPAMFLVRRSPLFFDWRRWCCTGMLVLGIPGMCFGMWAGAQLATTLSDWPGQYQVIASYALMMLGMSAGMLVPHALELAIPRKP